MKIILASIGVLLGVLLFFFIIIFPFTKISIGHYSQGERTGLLNKISKKGVLCKTYEGYILVGNGQNVNPETFYFTIKNEELAKTIQGKTGQIITLEYDQKLLRGQCWGETKYEITGIKN